MDNPDETDDLLRLGLHRLPRTQLPHLRARAPRTTPHARWGVSSGYTRVHTVAEQPGSGQIVIGPRRMRLSRWGHRGHGVRRAP